MTYHVEGYSGKPESERDYFVRLWSTDSLKKATSNVVKRSSKNKGALYRVKYNSSDWRSTTRIIGLYLNGELLDFKVEKNTTLDDINKFVAKHHFPVITVKNVESYVYNKSTQRVMYNPSVERYRERFDRDETMIKFMREDWKAANCLHVLTLSDNTKVYTYDGKVIDKETFHALKDNMYNREAYEKKKIYSGNILRMSKVAQSVALMTDGDISKVTAAIKGIADEMRDVLIKGNPTDEQAQNVIFLIEQLEELASISDY